ncbi:MAG: hypothetical protein AVDCRST_MAG47-2734, partial [uncultured Nocardioidaceae bacterium]
EHAAPARRRLRQEGRPGGAGLDARRRRHRGADPSRPGAAHAVRRAGDPVPAVRVGRAPDASGGGTSQAGRRRERADVATDHPVGAGLGVDPVHGHRLVGPAAGARVVAVREPLVGVARPRQGPGLVAVRRQLVVHRRLAGRRDAGGLGGHRVRPDRLQLPHVPGGGPRRGGRAGATAL